MTTDAARKAVFNTPELLENIISFLPYGDVLTKVKRLSRQWKEVVDSSPTIKNKLWTDFSNVGAVQPTRFTDKQTFPAFPYWGELEMPVYSHTLTFNTIFVNRQVNSPSFCLREHLDFLWPNENGSGIDSLQTRVVDFYHRQSSGTYKHPVATLRST